VAKRSGELDQRGDDSGDRPDAAPSAAQSYEQAVAELDRLVQDMEGGSLSLEQSLSAYRRGAELVQYCRKTLADVQQQVRILEAGLFKPFDDEADADGDKDGA
jgi:exodeoxyribonuclease VII small subunit